MEEKEIYLDTAEMADYFFGQLIRYGLVPSEDDLNVIANVMFDYMVHKGVITEEKDEDGN